MQAIILAAGMGKRLKDLTANNTKCMIKVNGVTLIERMLGQLETFHLSRIVIVVGYEGQKLVNFVEGLHIETPIQYINNPIYDKTNNIYSLALAKDCLVQEDTILLESDLIFEDKLLNVLLNDSYETLALVDKYENWMDGTVVKLDDENNIQAFIPKKKFVLEDIPYYYKTVNIYKFSQHFSATCYVPFLDAYMKALGNNEYYEQVLRVITPLDNSEIKAKCLNGEQWYEIDDIQDLDIASSIFAKNDEKVRMIQNRCGGYWRFPKLVDFCGLVNPYFPPQKLLDEMKSNFEHLVTQYPSGMRVNSLLASKNFGVSEGHILIGNGAAELIKEVMEQTNGRVGFIRPTFEEYPNRYTLEESVFFIPDNENFTYTADDVINYFAGYDIAMLVLINPDNPTGNYICKQDVLKIAEWSEQNGIVLLLDESFVDFADEKGATLIDEEVLQKYKNLIIVKSISKLYGIPGLRLGVLVSGNEALIAGLKRKVAIWNINSIGEFYMQIAEKYQKEYEESLNRLREARHIMYQALEKVSGLRPIPSQANYIMVEITNGITAGELTRRMLLEHEINIKNLHSKIYQTEKEYIRLAVRNKQENRALIQALRGCLE